MCTKDLDLSAVDLILIFSFTITWQPDKIFVQEMYTLIKVVLSLYHSLVVSTIISEANICLPEHFETMALHGLVQITNGASSHRHPLPGVFQTNSLWIGLKIGSVT
ncbi:hypothetical protein ES705_37144 [subsurface metagenome]